jgi:hypothetical protein
MTSLLRLRYLIAIILLLAAGAANAQWSWIDDKGVRQLSDRPPPPGTPASRILKAPRQAGVPAANATASKDEIDPRPLAERKAGFLADLRKMTAKEADVPTKDDRSRQRNCLQARKYKDWIQSGAPMNKEGENRPLTKDERAAEAAKADAMLEGCG